MPRNERFSLGEFIVPDRVDEPPMVGGWVQKIGVPGTHPFLMSQEVQLEGRLWIIEETGMYRVTDKGIRLIHNYSNDPKPMGDSGGLDLL